MELNKEPVAPHNSVKKIEHNVPPRHCFKHGRVHWQPVTAVWMHVLYCDTNIRYWNSYSDCYFIDASDNSVASSINAKLLAVGHYMISLFLQLMLYWNLDPKLPNYSKIRYQVLFFMTMWWQNTDVLIARQVYSTWT